MEKKEWTGIEMKEACMRAAKAFKELGITLSQFGKNFNFSKPKSKYHK